VKECPAAFTETKIAGRELHKKFTRLCKYISRYQSAAVAYSGGVDSSLVAYMCKRILPQTLCIIEDSPSATRDEIRSARDFCRKYKIDCVVIAGKALGDEKITKNERDRCYHCKRSLFSEIEKIRKKQKLDIVFDGSNRDDLGDFRPGRKALLELGVKSPLLESEFTKKDIRALSRILGLPTWNRPQMACLSSRISYGTPITKRLLERIEKTEKILKSLGYACVRARAHGDILRIEIGRSEKIDLQKILSAVPMLKKQGFKYITLDIEGYRTGSMNE
jgi:uncharacterized protein